MKHIGTSVSIGALLAISGVANAHKIDFNKDGKADILWLNADSRNLQAWYMNGVSRIAPAMFDIQFAAGWRVVGENDFNQDGNTDILWHNGVTGEIQIWFMDGITFSFVTQLDSSLNTPDLLGWKIVGTNDFNQDGHPDILWHKSTGESLVWFMSGATRLSAASFNTIPDSSGWQIVGTNDFDQDGKPDILWHKASTGELQVWFMNGVTLRSSAAFVAGLNTPHTLGWMVAGTDDFDGDGHPDLLWHHGLTGQSMIWFMDGLVRTSAQLLNVANVPESTGWQIGDGSTELFLPGDLASFGFQSMLTNFVDASQNHSLPAYALRPTLLIVAAFLETSSCPVTSHGPSPGVLTHSVSYYENLIFGPTGANVNGWLNAQSGGRAGLKKVATVVLNNVPGSFVAHDPAVLGGLLVRASNTFNFAPYDANNDGTVASSELNVIVVSNFHVDCLNRPGDLGANRFVVQSGVSGKLYGGPVAEYEENVAFDVATHEQLHSWGALDLYGIGLAGGSSIMGTSVAGVDGTTQYAADSLHKFLLGWVTPSQIISLAQVSNATIALDRGPALIYNNDTHEYILLENRIVGPYQANTNVGVMAWPVLLNSSDLQPNATENSMPTYRATAGGSSVTVNWMSSGTPAITYSVQSNGLVNVTRAF